MIREDLLRFFKEENNLLGLPQNYKGINLYPIKLLDFQTSKLITMIFGKCKKEIINNLIDVKMQKKAYKMSQLKLLMTFYQMQLNPNGVEVAEWIKMILGLLTKNNYEDVSIILSGEVKFISASDLINDTSEIYLVINGVVFTETDFDDIREIILEQNGMSVTSIDEFHPELEIALQQTKSNTRNDVTFSDDIFSFVSLLQKPVQEIENYTLYQFKKQYERLRMIEEYRALYPLEISGKIKVKQGVPHFDSHAKEKSRYDSIMVDMKEFEQNDLMKGTQRQIGGNINGRK